jgi:hypothetical protein
LQRQLSTRVYFSALLLCFTSLLYFSASSSSTFYIFLARCFLEEEEAEQYSREVKQRSKAE